MTECKPPVNSEYPLISKLHKNTCRARFLACQNLAPHNPGGRGEGKGERGEGRGGSGKWRGGNGEGEMEKKRRR